MGHTFTVPDRAYQAIAAVAASQGQTPEALFQAWLAEIERAAWRQMDVERDAEGNPVIYSSTAEFLASLGADEAQVARIRAREEAAERNGAVERAVFAE
jgi:hypothetical protein